MITPGMKAAVVLLASILCFCWSWTCQTVLAAESADRLTASGTGFFISSTGYFLTNYHVIRGATKVQIKMDDVVLDCRVVTVDAANDVAVLKADGSFQWLPLKGSATVSLGDDVFTIGFPNPALQGIAPKLTKGTISATSGIGDDPRVFQVSIPVQPGNSGGPLVDESGHAVGIVNASLSAAMMLRTSGALPQNVNYAIKSAYVLPLVEGIVAQNAAPSFSDNQTKQAIVAEVEKAVGLVLVYAPSHKETKPASPSVPRDGDTSSSSTPEIRLKILDLENRVAAAVTTHDASEMESLLADDYIGVLTNGEVVNKTASLNMIKNSTDICQYIIDGESLDIQMTSRNRAVATGIVRWKGSRRDGTPLHGALRFTDTWVERGARWRRTASEGKMVTER